MLWAALAVFSSTTKTEMQQRLLALQQQIASAAARAGRSADEITLIAVSKTRSLAEVQQALACGQSVFGENQVQDALSKITTCPWPQAEWHFIGHLQSNKIKYIPANFQWLHTLDSARLASKLDLAMKNANVSAPLNCLLQVNVSEEQTKSGLHVNEVSAVLATMLDADLSALRLRGLMTIGVQGNESQTRAAFAELRELRDRCREQFDLQDFDQLSMGMSDDFEIAIEEGATMVRIGTRLFGERNYTDKISVR
jgi:hypothetical protein